MLKRKPNFINAVFELFWLHSLAHRFYYCRRRLSSLLYVLVHVIIVRRTRRKLNASSHLQI